MFTARPGARSAVTVAAPVLVLLALTGCGSSQPQATPLSTPASSTAASDQPGASDASSSDAAPAPTDAPRDAADLATRMRTAMLDKQTATLSMSSSSSATPAASGQVKFTSAGTTLSVTSKEGGSEVTVMLVDGVAYLRTGEKIDGKSWVKIDGKAADPMSKMLAPLLTSLRTQSDPTAALAKLTGVPVTRGSTPVTVDGVPTTTYVLKQNSKQLIVAQPSPSSSAATKALAGASAVTTYYVDSQWLIHKAVSTVTVRGKKETVTMLYSKWGEPVTIQAPAASDVAAMPA